MSHPRSVKTDSFTARMRCSYLQLGQDEVKQWLANTILHCLIGAQTNFKSLRQRSAPQLQDQTSLRQTLAEYQAAAHQSYPRHSQKEQREES